ncbi:SdpI family protein [Parvularcula lutaonensis]|uniref:SdpI family protein n=1 Tax=Parvularcula lutaonensis TaxID=491923 RepID=A0ABV7MAU0_9PROT|nr:SdpI family protein [Parvularcula lutaonensis]GGY46765.1 immunity protein SdpI [Parvularcula lutaonensis]
MIRTGLLASAQIGVVMAGVTLVGFEAIEPGTEIARHWTINGEPDRFSPRNEALLALPALGALMTVLFTVFAATGWQTRALRESRGLFLAGWIGSLALLTVAQAGLVYANAGAASGELAQLPMKAVLAGASLLLIVIGNFLGKSRPNWVIGVRNPWTLRNERAWRASNRVAGWLFVATGAIALAILLMGSTKLGTAVLVGGAISTAVVATGVSVQVFRAERAES